MNIFLQLMLLLKLNFDLNYSEWSEDYPDGVEEILIRKEDRYLCYIEEKTNEKYLTYEEFGNRIIDYEDFYYTEESSPSETKPEKLKDRIIREFMISKSYKPSDVIGISFDNYDSNNPDVYFTKVLITDLSDNKIDVIEYENIENIKLENTIKLTFKEKININNIKITLYYNVDTNNESKININYIASDGHKIYNNEIKMIGSSNIVINGTTNFSENFVKYSLQYTYKDKLYKTYEINRTISEEYHNEEDDCEKVESSKKTFYSYITNEYVILDSNGKIVTSSSECKKSFCTMMYITKKEEPKEEVDTPVTNPKTFDSVYYYIFGLFISLFGICFIFKNRIKNLFLSNLFKK